MSAAKKGKRRGLSPAAWLGIITLSLFALTAVFGPLLAPYSPEASDLSLDQYAGPSWAHPAGMDSGTDLLSQLLFGARLAFIISATVVLISAVLGTALGVIAGYYGGWVDEVVMRVVDVLLAFPGILLNIAIVALTANPGIMTLIVALSVNGWVGYARLARGQVLSLREQDYVQAARCLGASGPRIMSRYLLPNLSSLILVKMSFAMGGVVLVEAALSFLGLGPSVKYTWGAIIARGIEVLWITPRIALVPGIAIMLVVLGSNLLGDGLRDRFDPKREVEL